MSWSEILLMKNELVLLLAALTILIADLINENTDRSSVINFGLIIVAISTVVTAMPQSEGELFGSMYITDVPRQIMKIILNLGTLLVLLQAQNWLINDQTKTRSAEYLILILSTLIGMGYMISAGHFLMFYLGLELATIPLAALAAYHFFNSKSAEAGIKFILLASFSSGILLFGLSLIYAVSGSFYFDDIIVAAVTTPVSVLGAIFVIAGIGFKISLVPFHLWTADVYEGSPINLTSYLSVVSKGAAVFILIILLYSVFQHLVDVWDPILWGLAVLTMTLGNLFALRQRNIKRFLAFSSIAQAGFILLGIIANTELGMTSTLYFVFVYVFSNLAAFGVATTIYNHTGKESIDDYKDLYKTNPGLSLIMLLAMFSLAGIPPVAGFFGKFFLYTAVAEKGYYVLLFIAVANATVSLYYYLLVVKAMFIDKSENPIERFKSNWSMRISLLICVVGMLAIGFASGIYDHFDQVSHFFFEH